MIESPYVRKGGGQGVQDNSQLPDMAEWTIKGRNDAVAGDPQDITLASLTERATPQSGDMLFGWNTGGLFRKFDIGNLPVIRDIVGTGLIRVTSSVVSVFSRITSFTELPQIATARILGRNTAGTGDIEELTSATTKALLALNNVDNTSDANKPISTATQTALNGKSDTSHGHTSLTMQLLKLESAAFPRVDLLDTRGATDDKGMRIVVDPAITSTKRRLAIQSINDSYGFQESHFSFTDANELGIGITNPLRRLHIVGSSGAVASFPSGAPSGDEVLIENANNSGLSFVMGATNSGRMNFVKSGDTAITGRFRFDASLDSFVFDVNTAEKLLVDSDSIHFKGPSGVVSNPPTISSNTRLLIENNGGNAISILSGVDQIAAINFYEDNYAFIAASITYNHSTNILNLSAFTGINLTAGGDNATVCRVQLNAPTANINASDTFISFTNNVGTAIGSISGTASSGVIAYNTFTGGHNSKSKSIDIPVDAVLISTGNMADFGDPIINYLPECEISTIPNDKRVYGTYGGHKEDGSMIVLGIGSGRVLVCNENGSIFNGDLLTSSSIPGHAMKYTGTDLAPVLGKARQDFLGVTGKIAYTHMAG